MNDWLLPNGMIDLLPPEAEKEAYAVEALMQEFAGFDYQRVKPPFIEFEESLLAGAGWGLARQTFRMMDPASRRMMGVRADMTPQIARIAASRFKKSDYPLRLMYAGDVLRVKGSQLRPERQFCQAGCELIGADHVEADIEIVMLPVLALQEIGIADLSMDLTLPAFVRTLLYDCASEDLMNALAKKDRKKVEALAGEYAPVLVPLLGLRGDLEKDLKVLDGLDAPQNVREDLARLQAVARGVQAALKDLGLEKSVRLTLDPLEHSEMEYHRGISFTLYKQGARSELGRGGRYDFETGEGAETATGFTLYMDAVRRVMPEREKGAVKDVPAGTSWKDIRKMQKGGGTVKREI
jgi:ATP phosphoribosyltransferase regulatory subunit